MSISENPLIVGTMVSMILYNRGRGYVTAVYGEVGKTPVRSLAGRSIMTGGSASFDIVFLTGQRSQRLPEAILRGVQWTVYAREDGFADADQLERLKTQADELAAEKCRKEAEAKASFDAEVERLRADPDVAHLKQGDEGSGTLAAANLRVLLKKRWPKTRFRIRKQHYGYLRVANRICIRAAGVDIFDLLDQDWWDSYEAQEPPEDVVREVLEQEEWSPALE
ncbi:MAG: hypothetical protein ABF876_09960 [Acetobacter aceti]|uniref:Large polyvalent protein associated domain-containing protein n=1 Tax=Acetobacter aceti TaxID=435 RepID=A0A1U9KJH3_ACEAC|nr:hypothetical protein [Acetobacter aceti]AQS85917.1 hypothetical protein A0U92_15375 [Acetobacter aceti]